MLKIGSVVGEKYKVLHEIGRGGMSIVYLAMNESANKQWAIKEVRKDGGSDHEVIRQNLIAETNILKRLHNEHLPSIIDVINRPDTFLIVMDYIEGVTLSRKLEEAEKQGKQGLPQDKVINWAIQICEVFTYLHTRKPRIIYRDTKPANIMLKPDGNVVLIDFGTAREYKDTSDEDTSWLGTRGYAAPEQFGGHGQTDPRTDIYNLGATMYHLLTGHNPCLYPYEMYPIRHWNRELSSGLEQIILKCTKPNPDERYQDAEELKDALLHYTELEYGYKKKRKRHRRMFVFSLLLSAAFLFAGIGCSSVERSLRNSSYENLVRTAMTAPTKEEQVDWYEQAIRLRPSTLQAYTGLLKNTFLGDGNFDAQEASRMTEILGYRGDGRSTNEEQLRSNAAAYDEFAYEMGLAYFYYYESDGNKPMSYPWFADAAQSRTLEDHKVERAKRFARIAGYYAQLNSYDKAGDTEVSYADYWDDLKALSDGDLVGLDNQKTALVVYRELVYQIASHALDFKKADVSKEDMEAELEKVEKHLRGDFAESTEEDKMVIEEIRTMIGSAQKALDLYYQDAPKGGEALD